MLTSNSILYTSAKYTPNLARPIHIEIIQCLKLSKGKTLLGFVRGSS